MKKTLLIATILSIFSFQPSILKAQQPDAVFKLLRYEWTLNPDGSSDYHYRHEVQILRTRTLIAYADKGETFVVYNPDIEELTVNEVYTIQADGRIVMMPQNAFIYQLPSECADCGRFNHMRELAMVHTGMELGCTIVVDYTIHRQYNLLHESIPLMRECPVEKLEVVVNYNNDMEMLYTIDGSQNLNTNNVTRSSSINTDNMNRCLHYTFVDMPQAASEPYMPADYIPVLRIYNGTPEFTPTFDEPSFHGAEEAMGQTMVSRNVRENLEAARNFFISNIHLNDIAPAHLGYTHATAAETWQSGCGTATDKANLLAAVLRAEGFRARVIGDEMDAVGVMVDTLEYRLDVRHRTPLTLIGEAKDEVSSQRIKNTLAATLDTLEDGFYRVVLPAVPGSPNIDSRRLPLQRTMPLQGQACDLQSDLTLTLPKGVKMVGQPVAIKQSADGIGSIEISIKQSGSKLRVVRNLKLDKSLIAPDEYARYRELLATWQSLDGILMRSK